MALKQNLNQHLNNTLIKFLLISMILLSASWAKNLDFEGQHHQQQHHNSHHHSHNRRLQRRDSSNNEAAKCDGVRFYFESIDIQLPQHFNEKGKLELTFH